MEVVAPNIAPTESLLEEFCREQGLDITELGVYGTYPYTDNAVIQFEDSIICYVASWSDRTVINPETAETVSTQLYGTPVAWASFEPVQTVAQTKKSDDTRTYVALKHETTFSVIQKLKKYGITEAEFVEHNGIKYGDLEEGRTYHLPLAVPKNEQTIIYEVFDEPQLMHVNKEGGAQKWAFGNVKTINDVISGSGVYPQNKEIGDIVAMVYVPIEGEHFAYYMDSLALGDYKETGKVKYMIGFAHSDLTLGTAPEPPKQDVPLPIEQQIQQTIATIEPELHTLADNAPRKDAEVLQNPSGWKATYKPFEGGPRMYVIDLPGDDEELLVHDLDLKRPDRILHNLGHYKISGTITKDGNEYGRPTQAVEVPPEKRNYYAIPMNVLKTEAEMYDTTLDVPDKVALHHPLTATERYLIPGMALTKLSYDRLKLYGKSFITKNKEK